MQTSSDEAGRHQTAAGTSASVNNTMAPATEPLGSTGGSTEPPQLSAIRAEASRSSNTDASSPAGIDPNHKFVYDSAAAANGRRVARDELIQQDEKMVKGYQEEIDTLLIFAGLFSAILTAFVAQTYQNLQEDKQETTNALLVQISQQLSDPLIHSVATRPNITVDSRDLRVNILWFISLILSLACSLFAIFVKQWLRSFMTWTNISHAELAIQIRQYRYASMAKWHLFRIIVALPVLLQVALVLFGVGLVDFTLQLNMTLGCVLGAVAGFCLLAALIVSFSPLFSPQSPFRSPWSEMLQALHSVLALLHASKLWALFSVFAVLLGSILCSAVATALRLKTVAQYFDELPDRFADYIEFHVLTECSLELVTDLSKNIGFFTWNQTDQSCIKRAVRQLQGPSPSPTPSMEARIFNGLLSVARDEDVFLSSILPCLYRRVEYVSGCHVAGQIHIADCCMVAGWFFGLRSDYDDGRPKMYPGDRVWNKEDYTTMLSPFTRKTLRLFLVQSLNDHLNTSSRNPALNGYASKVLMMIGCLLRADADGMSDLDQSIVQYIQLIIKIIDQATAGDAYVMNLNEAGASIYDALCIAFDLVPDGSTLLDPSRMISMWADMSSSQVTYKRVTVIVWATSFTLEAQMSYPKPMQTKGGHYVLSLMYTLSAVLKPKGRRVELSQVGNALRGPFHYLPLVHSEKLGQAYEASSLQGLNYAFWQAVYVLSQPDSRHSFVGTYDSYVRHLCLLAHCMAHQQDSPDDHTRIRLLGPRARPNTSRRMAQENVWAALLAYSHWLGSQNLESGAWICPSFEPIADANAPPPKLGDFDGAQTSPSETQPDNIIADLESGHDRDARPPPPQDL